jgi:UDP-3-O-[3-hydroxymyristoyl] glucosamine N-acyltransferase
MKLSELAEKLGLELRGDGELEIVGPATIDRVGPGELTFVIGRKYLSALAARRPGCVITNRELAAGIDCAALISTNPYADFARAVQLFFPPDAPPRGIHPTAQVAADAVIGEGASIGANCVIGAGVQIGRNAVIHPQVTIYPKVLIGDDFLCHSQVSIRERVEIGNRVTIHNGAVIGSEGFGFVEQDGALVKIPQVGKVIIEDEVEIGANATIDRATLGATIIRRAAKLDNLVHIGHNCEVGDHSRFAAQAGLAGSVKVGRWCEFGGQTGCADHLTVGDRVRVAAQSGIPNDVADGAVVAGYPAVDIRRWRRVVAALPRLPELFRRLRALEERAGIVPRTRAC